MELIRTAYASVEVPKVAGLLLLPTGGAGEEEAMARVREMGWRVEGGIVYPEHRTRSESEKDGMDDEGKLLQSSAAAVDELLRPNGLGVEDLKQLAEYMHALETSTP